MSEPTRLAQRIHDEYQAVPGLKLTCAQAARLWSAPEADCAAALNALVAVGILWLAPSGRYVALPTPDGKPVKSEPSATRCPHCKKRNALPREETIHGPDARLSLRCVACQRVFTFATFAA